jgi:PhnB protein
MTQIIPYLSFAGNCREVMTFYKECLGGELNLMTVAETPMASQMPAEMGQQIMHANLSKNGWSLMASDMNPNLQHGNSVNICISCNTEDELNSFFDKLSEGATINHPVSKFFAGTMGDLTDKFGINWMLYYGENMQQ